MRIAQVAPLYESVPPKLYGGTERVVSWLTEELVRLGHEGTLFASGDSMTTARLVPACRESLRLAADSVDHLPHHLVQIEQVDQEYFDTCIRPLLNGPDIEFVGEVGYPEKNRFLGNAAALLFPISWPEPFGLVMIEAMACGTPVIAYPFGSVPEVMANGVSGFIVSDLKRAVGAVNKIDKIDRKKVRKHFEQHFTAERMAREYLKIYERLVNRKKAPLAASNGVLSWMK